MLEKKLLEEVARFKAINRYGNKLIMEQEAPEEAPVDDYAAEPEVPAAGIEGDMPADDMPADDMPADDMPADDMAPEGDTTEEIDITDLVNMTKSIKKDLDARGNDNGEVLNKMDDVFSKLTDLEQKLSEMDNIVHKIESLGDRVEKMREKSPEEKIEMRYIDSYPYNQKPNEFFSHKQAEMEASGKKEYVLTKQDVQNYSVDSIKDTFNPEEEKDVYRY
jgi:hypothetical protein